MAIDAGQMYASLGLRLTGIAQAQQAFSNAMKSMSKHVADVQQRLTVLEQQASRTGKGIANGMKGVAPAVQTATKSIDQMGASIFQSAQRWRTFGYLFSIVVTAPMVMAGKQAIETAKNFDFAMAKIVGLVGLSEQAVAGLRKELMRMAPALAQTPQALAEASYYVTSAGFKDAAQALNIVELAAKGATAGLGETSDVAKLLVFSMNAYRQSGLTAERAADVFTAAVREGAIEAEGFAGAMQSVLPIASALGVKIEEVAGTMAAMSLQGASAQNAAVYLKGVLNSLLKLKPGSGGGKELEDMGVSVDGLIQKLKQPGGLMKVLIELKDLAKDVGGVPFLKTVFRDIRAMTGDLSLMGDNFEYNKQVIEAVTNASGDLTRAFDAQSDQMKKRLDSLKATMDLIKISFGEALGKVIIPALETLVNILNGLVRWFNSLSDGVQKLIIKFLGLLAAIGPIALIGSALKYVYAGAFMTIGKLLQKVLVYFGVLKVVTDANVVSMTMYGKSVKSAWGALGTLIKNPYVLIAAGAIALGLIIIKLIRKHNEFNRVQKDIAGQQSVEAGIMSQLFARASDMSRSLEQRKKTIEEINNRYGPYLKNLLSEKDSVEEIANAYLHAEKAQRLSMALKVNQEELTSKQQDTAKAFKNGFNKVLGVIGKQAPDMLGEFYNDVYSLADQAIKEGGGKIDQAFLQLGKEKLVEKYLKNLSLSKVQILNITGEINSGIDKLANKKVKEFDWIKQVDALTISLDKLNTSAKNTNATLGGFTIPEIEMPKGVSTKLSNDVWSSLGIGKDKLKTLIPVDDLKTKFIDFNKILKDEEQKIKDFFTGKGYSFGFNNEMDQLILSTKVLAKEIEAEGKSAKEQGYTFDKNAKLVDLYTKTVDDLRTGLGATNPVFLYFARLLSQAEKAEKSAKDETKELTDSLKDMKKFFDDFNSGLASIDMQKFILGPKFDVNSARLEFYKKSIEEYIKLLSTPDPKTGTIMYPSQDQMNRLKEMQGNVELYDKAIQDAIDRESAAMLNAEANAFGNVAGKVEVLNFELQASEKYLRDLLKRRYSGELIDNEEIKRTIQRIQDVKMTLVDLQNSQSIQYLENMNRTFYRLSESTDLFAGHITALENKLQELSNLGKGKSIGFKTLYKELSLLKDTEEIANRTTDALGQMFDILIEGPTETETVAERLNNTLHAIFQQTLKDIVQLIIKTLIWKGILSHIEGPEDIAKSMKDSVSEGLSVLMAGMKKMNWKIKTPEADRAGTAGGLAGMFGNFSGKNLSNPDELIPSGIIIEAASKKMKVLTDVTNEYGKTVETVSAIEKIGSKALETSNAAKQGATAVTQSLAMAEVVQGEAKRIQTVSSAAAIPVEKALSAVEATSIPITEAKTSADAGSAVASTVKNAAKLPWPLGLMAIGIGVGAVMAGIAAIIKAKQATKMAEGGIVPEGFPNDSFPALLTSGEVVIPEEKMKKMFGTSYTDLIKNQTSSIAKMAMGGVVPPGYPSDSFPALLSSGEKVIPLNRMEKENTVLEGEVIFEIGQDKLIGILRKGNKKNKIY
jgi:TP901 family phage tail tape measure protein